MQTFLGIRLWPKRLTDQEYVEQIRRTMSWNKWDAAAQLTVAAAYLAAPVLLSGILFKLGFQQAGNQVFAGLAFGFVVGLMLGIWAYLAGRHVHEAVQVLRGDRTAKLLLKYHDALAQLAGCEESNSEAPAVGDPSESVRKRGDDP